MTFNPIARHALVRAPVAVAAVAAMVLGVAVEASAQDACKPACATGQVCAQGGCLIPTLYASSSSGNPPPSTYQPGLPPPAGYPAPPAGYSEAPGYGPPPPYPTPGYPSGYAAPAPAYVYPPGYPPPPPPPPVAHVHDGFYLRMHLGGGYMRLTATDPVAGKLVLSGGSGSFGIALGGVVAPNLILFGNLFDAVNTNPNLTIDGTDRGTGSGSANVVGVGAGLAYYVQPINLYFSGTLAATQFELDDSNGNKVYDTDLGLGFQGMVGKEWWISQDWGIGVAGEMVLASMKDKNDTSLRWTASAFSLSFSATYN